MTDTITPEPTADDYRAAEKVLRAARFGGFRGGYDDEADWCKEEAARLEAESARDEEAERLAKRVHEALIPARIRGDKVPSWWADLVRAVLDQLAADGRLLPERGTVLTAEQVAEARELLDAVDLDAEEFHLLRAAFTPSAVSAPDGGPDGTPGKPWPTWQDVPEGVAYRSMAEARPISNWVNRGGDRFAVFPSGKERPSSEAVSGDLAALAPFVRVDGDKA